MLLVAGASEIWQMWRALYDPMHVLEALAVY